jgi:N-methylhydantoinase B
MVEDATAPGADPSDAAVIAYRLDAIAERMAEAMLRTARSPVFQIRDFVTGIFTGDGRWVATKDYIPVLAGSLPDACRAVIKRFGGEVQDGDVYVLNDPFHGNNHPPDVTVVKPVYHRGVLHFWAISKGHHADIGSKSGFGFDPYATTVWDEALRIPPVRLMRAGARERDVWELILLNVRRRDVVEGDLECQIGAVTIGGEELVATLDEFGSARVERAIAARLEASRAHMASVIARMPDGVYRAERMLDGGGAHALDPVRIVLEARVAGERIAFDFTGSDPQVNGYANSTRANTVAACMIGLFSIVGGEVERNSGSMAQFDVLTRPGTITEAVEPAATALCTLLTCEVIVETVWLALHAAAPEGSPAGWARQCSFHAYGTDPERGTRFIAWTTLTRGGSGAVHGCDGWHGIGTPVAMGGAEASDPELYELGTPVTVLSFELLEDSAGAGEWRGGAAARVDCRFETDGIGVRYGGGGLSATTAPFGLDGGGAGIPNRGEIHRRDGSVEPVSAFSGAELSAGDRMVAVLSGGGGHGDPRRRDPQAVLDDVRDGLVSRAAAERVYAVALDASGQHVDDGWTGKLRCGATAARGDGRS